MPRTNSRVSAAVIQMAGKSNAHPVDDAAPVFGSTVNGAIQANRQNNRNSVRKEHIIYGKRKEVSSGHTIGEGFSHGNTHNLK
jgi:hypothetical protein